VWVGPHLCKHRWIKLVENVTVFSVTGIVCGRYHKELLNKLQYSCILYFYKTIITCMQTHTHTLTHTHMHTHTIT